MKVTNGPTKWNGETLRRTLAQASCEPSDAPAYFPHHPLACMEPVTFRYHPDGSLECEHVRTRPEDPRSRSALHHSVALLILELASNL